SLATSSLTKMVRLLRS
ncbi:cytosol aminopeptidase family, catalytic domain protein, partial [Vibrio parahaemolyticus V-223/04]